MGPGPRAFCQEGAFFGCGSGASSDRPRKAQTKSHGTNGERRIPQERIRGRTNTRTRVRGARNKRAQGVERPTPRQGLCGSVTEGLKAKTLKGLSEVPRDERRAEDSREVTKREDQQKDEREMGPTGAFSASSSL